MPSARAPAPWVAVRPPRPEGEARGGCGQSPSIRDRSRTRCLPPSGSGTAAAAPTCLPVSHSAASSGLQGSDAFPRDSLLRALSFLAWFPEASQSQMLQAELLKLWTKKKGNRPMGLSSAWSDQPRRLPGSAGNCGPESEQRGSPGLLLFLRTCLRVSFPASTVSQSVTRNGYHWVGVSHTGILYSE